MVAVPMVTLNNGKKMPILGLGTWGGPKGEVAQAVKDAIDIGYRHFDCAYAYRNENEVGEGIKTKIDEGVIKREDLFITSKLWNTFNHPDLVRGALETTLKNFGLDYLDMYLIHWPMAMKEGDEYFPVDKNGKLIFSNVDFVDTWKEMEKLVVAGLTKSIGISNFNRRQIERILEIATIPPANLQIESHPYLNQQKLMAYCKTKNIAITAYSPLGSPQRPWVKAGDPTLLEDSKIVEIAKRYGKTPAQVLIRYQIDRGNIVIPKSVSKIRMQSNFETLLFQLNDNDIKIIDSFNNGYRFVPKLNESGHPHHPFENDEY